jgi:hypothetical protein
MSDARQHAPATERNREPILAVLREVLPATGLVLEVASGTGEHAVHFAAALPGLIWQPSDPTSEARASIAAWGGEAGLTNVLEPLALDAAAPDWPIARADAVLCINMVHISPWQATVGLFEGCSRVLSQDAPIVLYGPYLETDVETAPSNLAFDRSLRERNPAWGLRNVAEVDRLAREHGFARTDRYAMPANNLMLVYRPLPPLDGGGMLKLGRAAA